MVREIYSFLNLEFHIVLVFQEINLLRVVHNEKTLLYALPHVVLNAFIIDFKGHKLPTR